MRISVHSSPGGRKATPASSGKGGAGGCGCVRVEKMPRLQTSCTLVAEEGMVVSASTPDVRAAQERNLEFLLINHPLDCPICDKGGEGPLQDPTFAYGPGRSRLGELKRDLATP